MTLGEICRIWLARLVIAIGLVITIGFSLLWMRSKTSSDELFWSSRPGWLGTPYLELNFISGLGGFTVERRSFNGPAGTRIDLGSPNRFPPMAGWQRMSGPSWFSDSEYHRTIWFCECHTNRTLAYGGDPQLTELKFIASAPDWCFVVVGLLPTISWLISCTLRRWSLEGRGFPVEPFQSFPPPS